MDDVVDDLVRVTRRCEREAESFLEGNAKEFRERLIRSVERAALASSGSWIGYQANVYIEGLAPRLPGEHFDSMMGPHHYSETRGRWVEYDPSAVIRLILEDAGTTEAEFQALQARARQADNEFSVLQDDVLATLDAVLSGVVDQAISEKRQAIADMTSHLTDVQLAQHWKPNQVMTKDQRAGGGGIAVPPHRTVEARLLAFTSRGTGFAELAKHVRYVSNYLQKRHKMKGRTVAKIQGKIFIGHGQSGDWKDLRDFLRDRLHLQWDEFNRESVAGLSTKERLESMLDEAVFAFLVMTAEDEMADGAKHARANVIHEAGLFQGRLGFARAIILLEEGCSEFSNIVGVSQIRFAKGKIGVVSEEIRRVLERERIL